MFIILYIQQNEHFLLKSVKYSLSIVKVGYSDIWYVVFICLAALIIIWSTVYSAMPLNPTAIQLGLVEPRLNFVCRAITVFISNWSALYSSDQSVIQKPLSSTNNAVNVLNNNESTMQPHTTPSIPWLRNCYLLFRTWPTASWSRVTLT